MSITKTTETTWEDTEYDFAVKGDGAAFVVSGFSGCKSRDLLVRMRDLLSAVLADAASVAVAPKISTMPVRGDLGVSASGFDAKPYEGLRVTGEAKCVTTERYTPKVGDVVQHLAFDGYGECHMCHAGLLVITKEVGTAGYYTIVPLLGSVAHQADAKALRMKYIRPATPAERAAAGLPQDGGA